MISNITWGSDFDGLVEYLLENRDHEVLDLNGVSSIECAAEEMATVASLSSRAINTLLHISLSAAHEDGTLSSGQWLCAVNEVEAAVRLKKRQRVVVRHRDKTHDHVHIFWCTVSMETGCTPPKEWFLRKGSAFSQFGPHALSADQISVVPESERARRTYDFRILARCHDACRRLERQLNLRQLRTPSEAKSARLAGEMRDLPTGQKKRSERLGTVPLTARASEIRTALDTVDWPSKQRALNAIGLSFEPVFRVTKMGPELRGLVIFERGDPGNRIKASQLDTPTFKFGWRRLEERHATNSLSLGDWWVGRETETGATAEQPVETKLKAAFSLITERHRFLEGQKALERGALRRKQKLARFVKQRELQRKRKRVAQTLPLGERRAFYASFSREIRMLTLAQLAREHKAEAEHLKREPKPDWSQFLLMRANSGDCEAAAMLEVMRPSAETRANAPELPNISFVTRLENQPHLQAKPRDLVALKPLEILSAEQLLLAYNAFKEMNSLRR